MASIVLTQQMKRHAVIVALSAGRNPNAIAGFLNVARSFVFKVKSEMEASGDDLASVSERKKHSRRSNITRTAEFVDEVRDAIDADPKKSMRAIAKEKDVSEATIRRVVHEDIRYKSYVMRRGQFLPEKAKENRVIRSRRLLNKLKHPEAPGMLCFFLMKRTSTWIRR